MRNIIQKLWASTLGWRVIFIISSIIVITLIFLIPSRMAAIEKANSTYNFKTVEIEGCEYFVVPQHGVGMSKFYTLTHKGNCRACRAVLNGKRFVE